MASTDFFKSMKLKDCTYTIFLMDGDATLDGLGILAKYTAGPLGHLLALKGLEKPDPSLVAAGLRELGVALAAPDLKGLVYKMLEDSTVLADKAKEAQILIKAGNIDMLKGHFRGRPGDLIQLAWFAIKENYANFIEALPGLAALLQQAKNLGPA